MLGGTSGKGLPTAKLTMSQIMDNQLKMQVKNEEFKKLLPRKSIVRTILTFDKE